MKRLKYMSLLLILNVGCLAVQVPVSHAEDLTSYLPISSVTPGATNPAVSQSNIASTICISGYTKTIRPTSPFTTDLKIKQLAGTYSRYGSTKTSLVEEDHLIPLEIGGSPKSVENLWAQLWDGTWGARKKDQLENKINSMVCSRTMTLRLTSMTLRAILAAKPGSDSTRAATARTNPSSSQSTKTTVAPIVKNF
jgi:hypothetical protein